ncbi:UPF0149 family protein [Pleionea sp. CnH1-48]|uniref:UPF0149 family protein n=1 Tax=Pleionea sp. CnH1-48 TaxID=2954494 RepID=UPI0020977720|nr:UPF0149 family protein [Pleionea sp. CnH1-48]MCO7227455.1 UPF0149 family protein [Pleionea sp. CnH1-48]
MNIAQPLNEQEIDELNHLLTQQTNGAKTMNISELDGFLTAIVVGPDSVMPSQWFNRIWGEESVPTFEDDSMLEHVFTLSIRHMNGIAYILQNAVDEFEPIFEEEKRGNEWCLSVGNWCSGFVKGMSYHMEAWSSIPEALSERLKWVLTFATPRGRERLKGYDPEEVERERHKVTPLIKDIYLFWLAKKPYQELNRAVVHQGNKVGRNDPCPCNSGKKYKKCCGLN